jgi:hypothetical protein
MLGDDVGQRRRLQPESVVFALSSADDLRSAAAAIVEVLSLSAVRVAHSGQARLHLRRSMDVIGWRPRFRSIDSFRTARPGLLARHRGRRVLGISKKSKHRRDAAHDGEPFHNSLPLRHALRDQPVRPTLLWRAGPPQYTPAKVEQDLLKLKPERVEVPPKRIS